MCCISGLIFKDLNSVRVEEKKRLINELTWFGEDRGKDATGICLINSKTNDIRIFKKDLEAEKFLENDEYIKFIDENLGNCNIVLIHNRWVTQGTQKNNKNNHPIFNKSNNSVLIHNGMVHNYKDVVSALDLELDGDVDSELILKLYELYDGDIRKVYNSLTGEITFALYHNNKLNIFRDRNELFMAYNKKNKTIMFSSEKDNIFKTTTKSKLHLGIFLESIFNKDIVYKKVDCKELMVFDFNIYDYSIAKEEIPYDWNSKQQYLQSISNISNISNSGELSKKRRKKLLKRLNKIKMKKTNDLMVEVTSKKAGLEKELLTEEQYEDMLTYGYYYNSKGVQVFISPMDDLDYEFLEMEENNEIIDYDGEEETEENKSRDTEMEREIKEIDNLEKIAEMYR